MFTGDPHPGNIMVAKRETLIDWTEGPDRGAAFRNAVGESLWAPVLIDFGLTKRISAKMRLAFAKMVVSAELLDYGGVLDAYNVSVPICVTRCGTPIIDILLCCNLSIKDLSGAPVHLLE